MHTLTRNLVLIALSSIALVACDSPKKTFESAAPPAVDATAEEYGIYKIVIEDVCQPVEPMPILNKTVANDLHDPEADKPYDYVRLKLTNLDKETLADFIANNRERQELDYKIDLTHGNVLVSDADAEKVPSYPGYAEISRVGFDTERKQALVYCGHRWKLSGLQGQGYYVLLAKRDGVWTITDKLTSRQK